MTTLLVTLIDTYGQNVGIGTPTPADKLSVETTVQGYGITHTYGAVKVGTYLTSLNAQFGTKSNHPLQFFTNNGAAQVALLQNGNFGIGTIAPAYLLEVAGNIASTGSTGGFRFNDRANTAKGYQWYSTGGNAYLFRQQAPSVNAISVLENGSIGFNVDVPQTDLHVNPNGAGSILIGTNKNTGGYTNLEMGITAQSGGGSYIQSTRSSGLMPGSLYLNPGGEYVGINMASNSVLYAPLDINQSSSIRGIRIRNNVTLLSSNIWDIYVDNQLRFMESGYLAAYIGDDGSWNQVSDARLKTGIIKMETVLDKVMALQPKKYQYINNNPTHKISSGFLSQDVMQVFPELVSDFQHPTSDTSDNTVYHAINYAGFNVIVIKAIQEQQIQIEAANEKNNKQADLIEKMQEEINALKQR